MIDTKKRILFLISIIFVFIIIYSPHFNNQYPLHTDEYHHITEAIKLKQTGLTKGLHATEIGFYIILAFFSYFADLVLIYRFLPAIWAMLSAIIIFYIVKNKTSHLKNSFFIAILSIIFFASIKSNVNITGLWFFTPLTFSIPFIFLYIYLFSEGLKNKNKKQILYSLLIMIFLIPIHAISVLFAIPILLIFSIFNLNYIKKEYKFFSLFLLIPILGIMIYSQLMDLTILTSIKSLLTRLQFSQGWGVLEIKNSFFEIYSPIGYLLAILGFLYVIHPKNLKEYLIYVLWPAIVLVYIIIFKINSISFLSPYQRNLYYFAISLPFLSSLGLYSLLRLIKISINIKNKEIVYKIISIILIVLILFLTFKSYYYTPENIGLYKTINNDNYEALKFLSSLQMQENIKIMAPAEISTAIFPVSGYEPVATIFFYGNRSMVENFFRSADCQTKNQIIKINNVSYVLSEKPIDCNWKIIYEKNNNFIYKII